ncbi:MAG: hypothetical protein M1831_005059 [Alyxoria varia]|nr:MAG: hypothetical protein M1831_005059 [Alyxoria varia]
MPSISEDELCGEADEPPDNHSQSFNKTRPAPSTRKESLLSKALHTDAESHDEDVHLPKNFNRQTSRSSTCSNFSGKFDLTSDDGVASHGTRASTPSSPPHHALFKKPDYGVSNSHIPLDPPEKLDPQSKPSPSKSESSEPIVEANLGRKRCITFACGRTKSNERPVTAPETQPEAKKEASAKRPSIKFACPFKSFSKSQGEEQPVRKPRHLSPPPPNPRTEKPSSSDITPRPHRDSDTTIRNDSPRVSRKMPSTELPKATILENEPEISEATRFHEFASSDENVEEWVQESTCHKSRLTVADTLEKEEQIRQIGQEAEEEIMEEEDAEDEDDDEDEDELDEDEVSDLGFQTDDEDGFAESDEESDGDSDYEWWAPRKSSPRSATMVPPAALAAPTLETASLSSTDFVEDTNRLRVGGGLRSKARKRSQPLPIRSGTPKLPDLPDSTDFVCGTLDEDRPIEEAYLSCLEQRKAAKHRATPQDVDPTLPASDPNVEDDDDDDDVGEEEGSYASNALPGSMEDLHFEEPRGRKLGLPSKPSPSPKRLKSPPPPKQRLRSPPPPKRIRSPAPTKRMKSPPPANRRPSPAPTKRKETSSMALDVPGKQDSQPRALFGGSPRNPRSPIGMSKITSPPPSRRGSYTGPDPLQIPYGTAFLGHRPTLTHTTSLPRSPNPFARKRAPYDHPAQLTDEETGEDKDDEEDDGDDTAIEGKLYARGAIDIVQGLERKRLRRRQKFYEKLCRKEEKKQREKAHKRPQPGKGAERMKQVGIECAIYQGKRVLSV